MYNNPSRRERRFSRESCMVDLTYALVESSVETLEESQAGLSKDLSRSGICILSPQKVKPPALVRIKMSIPDSTHTFLMLGKVVRCAQDGESHFFELGVKIIGYFPPELAKYLSCLALQENQENLILCVRFRIGQLE